MSFFFSSRRRHTRSYGDWSSDVCSSDLMIAADSMRHADVVSQIISWTELPHEPTLNVPKKEFLDAILQIEDKEIGRASCRERVWITAGAGGVKEKKEGARVRCIATMKNV